MRKKRLNSDTIFSFFNLFFLLIVLFLMLYPFWYVVMTSFSDAGRILKEGNVILWPRGFSLDGYKQLLMYKALPQYFINTLIYVVLGTLLRIIVASLAGYSLSVKRFVAGKFIMIAMVITMFISGGLIPTYMLIKSLNGFDTIWVMVIPGAIDVYTCIVFKTFFQQLPGELKDAAEIDGANDLLMLTRIILPVSKPLLATFAIFAIVGYWNEWFSALLYLNSKSMHPIQMFLRNLLVSMQTIASESGSAGKIVSMDALIKARIVRMCSIVVSTLPIILIYPFFQRFFTKGIIVGSLKG